MIQAADQADQQRLEELIKLESTMLQAGLIAQQNHSTSSDRGELVKALLQALKEAQRYVQALRGQNAEDKPTPNAQIEAQLRVLSDDIARIVFHIGDIQQRLEDLQNTLNESTG